MSTTVVVGGITYTFSIQAGINYRTTLMSASPAPSGILDLNAVFNVYPFTAIYQQAFINNTAITSVICPPFLSYIGNGAFDGCTGITNITFPADIIGYLSSTTSGSNFGTYSFLNCTGLNGSTIFLPPGLSLGTILGGGSNTFGGISNATFVFTCLKQGPAGSNVTVGAFTTGNNITLKYTSPDSSWTSGGTIDGYSISPYTTTTATVGGVTYYFDPIDGTTLLYPGSTPPSTLDLTAVYNVHPFTSIAAEAFLYYGSTITSVILPNQLQGIYIQAFATANITTLTLPTSLKYLGTQSFGSSSTITHVNFNSNLQYINFGAFQSQSNITSLILPNSTLFIESSAFSSLNSTNITSFNFPNNLQHIGSYAFQLRQSGNYVSFNGITVTIPSNLKLLTHDFYSVTDASFVFTNTTNTYTTTPNIFTSKSTHDCKLTIYATSSDSSWHTTIDGYTIVYGYVPPTPAPCFPRGTPILTPDGYKLVETLREGDTVRTADGRDVPIKLYNFTIKNPDKDSAPYCIHAGALGHYYPPQDVCLSPRHTIQDSLGIWQTPKRLAMHNPLVKQYSIGKPIEYYHIECPNFFTDDLIVGGAVVESYKNEQGPSGVVYVWNKELNGFIRNKREEVAAVPTHPHTLMLTA